MVKNVVLTDSKREIENNMAINFLVLAQNFVSLLAKSLQNRPANS